MPNVMVTLLNVGDSAYLLTWTYATVAVLSTFEKTGSASATVTGTVVSMCSCLSMFGIVIHGQLSRAAMPLSTKLAAALFDHCCFQRSNSPLTWSSMKHTCQPLAHCRRMCADALELGKCHPLLLRSTESISDMALAKISSNTWWRHASHELTACLVFQQNTHSIETTSVDRCCSKHKVWTYPVSFQHSSKYCSTAK